MPHLLNNAGRKAGVSYLRRKSWAARLPDWKPFAGMAKQTQNRVHKTLSQIVDCAGLVLSRHGQMVGEF